MNIKTSRIKKNKTQDKLSFECRNLMQIDATSQ